MGRAVPHFWQCFAILVSRDGILGHQQLLGDPRQADMVHVHETSGTWLHIPRALGVTRHTWCSHSLTRW
jgi:hypothetical protein